MVKDIFSPEVHTSRRSCEFFFEKIFEKKALPNEVGNAVSRGVLGGA